MKQVTIARIHTSRGRCVVLAVAASAFLALPCAGEELLLEDTLQGSTTGVRSGGVFVADGWMVTGKNDCIYWHLPTLTKGAVEWDVRGLQPNECREGMTDKIEIFHMYDYTVGGSDTNYLGGYRDNPYKHFVRKIGCFGGAVDAMELVWVIEDNYLEPDTPVLDWDPAATYRFREEWGPEGEYSRLQTYRDGVLIMTITLPGLYAPAGLSIRIAASIRRDDLSGAPIDAVYSNVQVWDLSESVAPIIAEVAPDPDFASPGLEYTRHLVLDAGNPSPSWTILAGPPGRRIDASGRVSGWIPAASDLGKRFDFKVRASNSEGFDEESWSVEVVESRTIAFPFDGDAEGWTLSVWKAGQYNPGTIAWDASSGNPGGGILMGGAGDSNNMDSCTREGSIMTRVVSTAGLRSVRVEYDLLSALDAPPGPSGEGNCTVLEGTSDDKLAVYYSTRGVNGPWVRAQVIPEIEMPRTWAHKMFDLSSTLAAGDNPAFALKFQWQFNSRADAASIDNIQVRGAVIEPETKFRRGDANVDGTTDISDVLAIIYRLYISGTTVTCEQAADADDDGLFNISDAIYILNFLFLNGEAIKSPAATCGVDPTRHDLSCDSFLGCP